MSNPLKYFEIAFNNQKKQKLRTFLTVFAMAIGIASLVVMIAASENFKKSVTGQLDIYSPNSINVEVRVPGNKNDVSVNITTFKNSDVEAIRRVYNVEQVYSYVTAQASIKYDSEKDTVIIFGYGSEAGEIEKMDFEEGGFYTVDQEYSLSSVIVLGKKIKEKLFGDAEAVGQKVYIKGKPFEVVGVMKAKGGGFGIDMDKMVYIPSMVVQKKILGTDYVMGVMALVKNASKINETKEEILSLMRDRHEIEGEGKDDFEVMTMEEARKMVDSILSGITFLLIALIGISLVVAGVGITNIMYVTVVERTFEIGLRMSIGAEKKDILWQFIAEALLLTFMGGVLGIIIGTSISYLIYYLAVIFGFSWSPDIPLWTFIFSFVFSGVVGLFFGVYPAKKASNLNPIEAIRKE
ncbi:ABC transporter permease [bacterium]|nr:ABC transporter permease [bacterium]